MAMKESAIQRQITDLLSAEGIFWTRNNTGAMKGTHKGKPWYVRFGMPGMADLTAYPRTTLRGACAECGFAHAFGNVAVLHIEVKAGSKQSEAQASFQAHVEGIGHYYLLARSVDAVIAWLKEHR